MTLFIEGSLFYNFSMEITAQYSCPSVTHSLNFLVFDRSDTLRRKVVEDEVWLEQLNQGNVVLSYHERQEGKSGNQYFYLHNINGILANEMSKDKMQSVHKVSGCSFYMHPESNVEVNNLEWNTWEQ